MKREEQYIRDNIMKVVTQKEKVNKREMFHCTNQ